MGEVTMSDDKRPKMPITPPTAFHIEPTTSERIRAGHPPGPGLDGLLREYLEKAKRDEHDGNTIAVLRQEVHETRVELQDTKLEVHETRREISEVSAEQRLMRLRLDRHGRDIRDLKAKVFHTDPEEHDTGVHQVNDLKRHLAELEHENKTHRDSVWWRRTKIQWVAAAIGAVLLACVGGVGTILWYVVTHMPPAGGK